MAKNHALVKKIYRSTKTFPKEEQFGLTSQIRRSASSITANIAEGWGRYHTKDKIRFYYLARGSATETQNHLILAFELGYIDQREYNELKALSHESYLVLCGLIKSLTKKSC